MSADLQAWLTVALVVLARVSAFVAVLPFVSAARVPQIARAYAALGVSLAMTPVLHPSVAPVVQGLGDAGLIAVIANEVIAGVLLGFLVRLFFLALSFTAEFVAQLIGHSGLFVQSVTDDTMTLALADLIVLFVTVLFLIGDLHLAVIDQLARSFDVLPAGTALQGAQSMEHLVSTLTTAFLAAMQLSGPFLLYVFVCNVLLGLANRLVPQVPIQLVALPMVLFGGLAVALLVLVVEGDLFIARVGAWIDQN